VELLLVALALVGVLALVVVVLWLLPMVTLAALIASAGDT
jgi:hypothetical protein